MSYHAISKKAIEFYFSKGFTAFPVKIIISNEGKKIPEFPVKWRTEQIDKKGALRLVDTFSGNALAIKTGKESNLFVLDVDRKNGKDGHEALKDNGIIIPEDIPRVRTQSKGAHYYFTYPNELKNKSTSADTKNLIDIRGDGGLVFAPPAKIADNLNYKWEVKINDHNFRKPPYSLIKWLLRKKIQEVANTITVGNKSLMTVSEKQKKTFFNLLRNCASLSIGERSEADFTVVAWGIKIGLSRQEIFIQVRNIGKFAEKAKQGQLENYFTTTYKNALNQVECDPKWQPNIVGLNTKQKENTADIFSVLDNSNTVTDLYLSQDYKSNKLWYGLKTTEGIIVINSKKEYLFYDDIKSKNQFNILSIPSTFKIKSSTVKLFLQDSANLETDYIYNKYLALDLYHRINNHLKRYIFFKNKNESKLIAVWILGTYLFSIFRYYPYLHVKAEKRSGKSLLMEIMSNLAFNGKYVTSTTEAVLFRSIQQDRNSLFIDEVERFRTKDKELYGAIMCLLNGGFQYNGSAERAERTKDGFKIKHYSTYSPKCFAGINDLDDVLKDRTISIKLLRKKVCEKIDRYKLDHSLAGEIEDIKQNCYLFGLKYAETLNQFYNKKQEIEGMPESLTDRERDIYEPLFIIANAVQLESELNNHKIDLLESMNVFAGNSTANRKTDDSERNKTSKAIKILSEIIDGGKINPIKITNNGNMYNRDDLYQIFMHEYKDEFPWVDTQTKMVRLFGSVLELRPENHLHQPKQKQYIISNEYLADMKERFLI